MPKKVQITERALVQRLNRKLAKENELLRAGRGERDLGRYFVVDTRRNLIVRKDVDLESLARDIGAIAPWEELGSE